MDVIDSKRKNNVKDSWLTRNYKPSIFHRGISNRQRRIESSFFSFFVSSKGRTLKLKCKSRTNQNMEDSFLQKSFAFGSKKYILRNFVEIKVTFKDGLWIYQAPEFDLYSYSYDKKEAFNDLNEDFAFQYDDLINESDEKLTPEALKMRDKLRESIESIKFIGEI